jgi:septum formation protein
MPSSPHLRILLASASAARATMLRNAGLDIDTVPARIDEPSLRAALAAEGASPRDQADALAEAKARKVSQRNPGALTLGCDQILSLGDEVFAKPEDPLTAADQLTRLSGGTHHLWSAAVICQDGAPIWRHVSEARMTMHTLTPTEISSYLAREWDRVSQSVGAYHIEEAGSRLMSRIEGDHFTILGLPLIPLLTWLRVRGDIAA